VIGALRVLIVLAPIRPAAEHGLREVLAEVQRDPAHNPYVRLADSPSTHFARWVIVDEESTGPRLLFAACYDGGIEAYIAELAAVGPGMDRLWGACEGYTGREQFAAFVRDHYCKERGVYIAFPGRTVAQVRNTIAIREQIESFLDLPEVGARLGEVQPFLDRLARQPKALPLPDRVAAAVNDVAGNVGRAAHAVMLRWFLAFAAWFAQQGQSPTWPKVHGGCSGENADRRDIEQAIQGVAVGDEVVQNGMTTVTHIRPEKLARVRLALAGTSVLSRVGWAPGEFANVGTLHWFAWALLDGGERLLFISTFDGSWQNYMQDFMDKLVWGLDALYGNTYGYPASGMKDTAAFTDYILSHQYAPQVVYGAYPPESVMNLIRDEDIATAIAPGPERPAVRRWLQWL
jgi:hypothetical protein